MKTIKFIFSDNQQFAAAAEKADNDDDKMNGIFVRSNSIFAILSAGIVAIYVTPLILVSILETNSLERSVGESLRGIGSYVDKSANPFDSKSGVERINMPFEHQSVFPAAHRRAEIRGLKTIFNKNLSQTGMKVEGKKSDAVSMDRE